MRVPVSPAKEPKPRALVRIALDLALESRERLEAELIAAQERIKALEEEVARLAWDAGSADFWQDVAALRQEQLTAATNGDPVPEIGITVEGAVGIVKAEQPE